MSDVRTISDAGENAQRREAIATRLDALGVRWRKAPFEASGKTGENLIAEVSGAADAPLLLIGAHSDRVAVGHGATDNASGSASVLALAERFQRQPLKHHRVAIAFWDLEEEGLLGSKAFVADGSTKPALYVNFDVFGWGDTLWMMAPGQAQAALVDSSRTATQALQLGFSPGEQYPPTDHLPFLRAGWPAVSYSLVGEDEITQVLAAYAGKKPHTPAKVMRVIHTDQDVIGQIDAAAAVRGVDAVERALRDWDAKGVTASPTTTSESSR
ncbi:M28 family peptidase [Lysobacter soli]|uniref:M28 family peptidase n=1 Tax=Lysobacter soli TaxID=453783 RepID=UPI00240FFB8D|nr:M28 family peptidase [Lysobacter soli]MDG2518607.1 M28 family peptidase [Lysobacter soli]